MIKTMKDGIIQQQKAYKLSFAKEQLEKTCDMMVSHGFCHHKDCEDCEKCALQQAHNIAVQEILTGARKAPEVATECHNYGATRSFHKGHKTIVWHDYKEEKK